MKEFYEIEIGGITRRLPLCKLNEELNIGAFVIFGDVELTEVSARELLKVVPEYDIMITAESKGIPLVHEMARQSGENTYLLARKMPKLYMKNCIGVEVTSITTAKKQMLYLDESDLNAIKGKRVLIVDDVVSTGESMAALESLVKQAGGMVAGRAAILAEGDAAKRDDVVYLAYLPLFDKNGDPIEA